MSEPMSQPTNRAQPDDGTVSLQLRRLRRTVRGLVVVVATLPVMALSLAFGQTRPSTVQAERFELIDAQGRVLAVLGVDEGETALSLFDTEGRQRLTITHADEQTGLFILDDRETVRLGAAQFAHGGGGIALHGPEAKGAAVLYLKESGSLTFYGPEGEVLERVAPKAEDGP